MKRRDLERHVRAQGAEKDREGSNHTIWRGPAGKAPIPRHTEVSPVIARKVCRDLGIPEPPNLGR